MIIETILSSIGVEGQMNFAPVGVHVPDDGMRLKDIREIEIFLYSGSHTFNNLKITPQGVINFTDDVLLFVETALFSNPLPFTPSLTVLPPRLATAKTIWEFSVTNFDDSRDPARVNGKILHIEERDGFSGFCRAHAVILEATILATRIEWIHPNKIIDSWPAWQEVVAKTGGTKEQEAFRKVAVFLKERKIPIPDMQIG